MSTPYAAVLVFLGAALGAALRTIWHRHRLRPGAARFLPEDPGCDCHCVDCRNDQHDDCPVECRRIG